MKVLQISTPFLPVGPDLKYGGSERVVYLLDKELHSRGNSAGVVAPSNSNPASFLHPTILAEEGVASILDKGVMSDFEGFCLRSEHIAQAIKYSNELPNIDIVHFHDDNILPFDFLINRPTLMTLHTDISSFWNLSRHPFIASRKTKFVSISESQKRFYESQGHRIDYVIYNGVDQDIFSVSDTKYPYLLTLGSIQPVKSQHNSLEIGRRTGLDVIVAGNIGNQRYFEERVKPYITNDLTKEEDKLSAYASLPSNSPKVVYVGAVSDRQKAPLYSHAKAFLMPIEWDEPFGLVMVEAMMSGTPVLAYRSGSVPEVVKEGTGIIIPSGNIEGIVSAVNKVDKINTKQCREIAINFFGKAKMADNYMRVYQDIFSIR